MSQMTAVQVSGPGGAFQTVNRQVPEPWSHTVRIKIQRGLSWAIGRNRS